MPDIAYVNGQWLPRELATVSIDDRGLLMADAVFETARWRSGRFFRLHEHLQRLEQSAATLSLKLPDPQVLADIANELARRCDHDEASLRMTVTGGDKGHGLARVGAGEPTTIVTLNPLAPQWRERAARGWTVKVSPILKPSLRSTPAHLKSVGRTFSLLAAHDAKADGFDDALLLSADGLIAEGPTWNVFWVEDRTLFTPSLQVGVLEGVTRRIILQLATAIGLKTAEVEVGRDALENCSEIFATMTSNGVVPFAKLDAREFRLGPDTFASMIQTQYWELVDAELAQ